MLSAGVTFLSTHAPAAPPRLDRSSGSRSNLGSLLLVLLVVFSSKPGGVATSASLAIILAGVMLVALRHPGTLREIRLPAIGTAFVMCGVGTSFLALENYRAAAAAASLVVPFLAAAAAARLVPFVAALDIVDRTMLLVISVSLTLGIVAPGIAVTQVGPTTGALKGLFWHKNHFGFFVVLSVGIWGARWTIQNSPFRTTTALRIVVYAATLAWIDSTGSILLGALIVLIVFICRRMRYKPSRKRTDSAVVAIAYFGAIAVVSGPLLAPWLLDRLGKVPSMEGRLAIWNAVGELIQEHPWIGYGRGFSLGSSSESSAEISQSIGYEARSVHNGYLAVALESGVVAAALGVLFLVTLLFSAYLGTQRMTSWAVVARPVLMALALVSFYESRAFHDQGWAFLCLIACWGAASKAQRE
ncbi:O-antigen ligase family protein [Nocardioides sp. BGMRC 2183]|nr:O-antigen ligase family protein [Nocardioides sp. BGMRC 2183]